MGTVELWFFLTSNCVLVPPVTVAKVALCLPTCSILTAVAGDGRVWCIISCSKLSLHRPRAMPAVGSDSSFPFPGGGGQAAGARRHRSRHLQRPGLRQQHRHLRHQQEQAGFPPALRCGQQEGGEVSDPEALVGSLLWPVFSNTKFCQ